MTQTYALVNKALYDSFEEQAKKSLIAVSTTSDDSNLVIKNLSGVDYVLFEGGLGTAALVKPFQRRILDGEELRDILESGIYTDPFLDVASVEFNLTTTPTELNVGVVINREKLLVRNTGNKDIYVRPFGSTVLGTRIKRKEEKLYDYDSTQRLEGYVRVGTGKCEAEEVS